jgi:hypothetical protein
VLPFVAWLLTRRRGVREGARVGIVFGAAVSYAALFLLLFAQAMIGQPLIAPSGAVASAFAAWAVGTVVLVLVAWRTLGATVTSRSALEIA